MWIPRPRSRIFDVVETFALAFVRRGNNDYENGTVTRNGKRSANDQE